MTPWRRSALMLIGTWLLSLAFLFQSRSALLDPFPSTPLPSAIFAALLCAALVYAVSWVMTPERAALAAATVSAIFFLLNPLLNEPHFFLEPWNSLRGPLLT